MPLDRLQVALARDRSLPVGLRTRGDVVGSRLMVDRLIDPVFLTLTAQLAQTPTAVAPDPPEQDGRAYPVEGATEQRCRPYLRVIEEESAYLSGPQLRFDRRDDGMYLTVKLEEDRDKRVAGAVPFDVRVTSLALAYGTDTADRLEFSTVLLTPLEDPAGPAFRVEAEAKVPVDRQEQIVRDLRGPDRSQFVATLELDWIQPAPPPPAAFLDVLELSPAAHWQGAQLTDASGNARDGVDLPFNGSDGDPNGFVILSDVGMEDGTVRHALRTHPKWVDQGTIKGWHAGRVLPPGARFEAQVGFVGGAAATDGVEFIIFEHHTEAGAPVWNEVLRVHK